MIAYVDIENAMTKKVITLELPILNFSDETFEMDISSLKDCDLDILKNAINPDLKYTDIEMFFVDDDNVPYFGPDYAFSISNTILKGQLTRIDMLGKGRK